MRNKLTYILMSLVIATAVSVTAMYTAEPISVSLLTTEKTYTAGDRITLSFSKVPNKKPKLYIASSYGTTLLDPEVTETAFLYHVPSLISNKASTVNWKLMLKDNFLTGNFTITPILEVKSMESYLGPPSINAGGDDYTMLTVLPTDSLDNVLPDSTKVAIKRQFKRTFKTDTVLTHNLYSYKLIYSTKQAGRIFTASNCLGIDSKEKDVNVMPDVPVDFTIGVNRLHEYADGNQIAEMYTSQIKDEHNNIVSDGTYVTFYITNKKGYVLKTSGNTINGKATARIIHPDYAEHWQIKAYVEGMAESNTISIDFEQVVADFETQFSKNNREVTIGPIKSYMDQMIPDGLIIELKVYDNQTLVNTFTTTTRDGYAAFTLKQVDVPNNTYNITVELAGINKTYTSKTLW